MGGMDDNSLKDSRGIKGRTILVLRQKLLANNDIVHRTC